MKYKFDETNTVTFDDMLELKNFYRLTKDLQVKHIIKVGLKLKYL